MKRTLIYIAIFVIITSFACKLSVTEEPSASTAIPVSTTEITTIVPVSTNFNTTIVVPTVTETSLPPSVELTGTFQMPPVESTSVVFGRLSLVIPSSVANGASGKEYPCFDSEDAAYWQKTPGHLQVMLGDYYVLQGKFQQPTIYVYPAQAYAEMVPAAFESIRRVNNILYSSGNSITEDQLPTVPFFNAKLVFASNMKIITFQNGSGIRFLTEIAQYPASVNNNQLFYNFQGVTHDGTYYIVAVFPITTPGLAETSDTEAALPINGISYPDMNDPNADWNGYYTAAVNFLNTIPADSFTPTLEQLDELINSILIDTP